MDQNQTYRKVSMIVMECMLVQRVVEIPGRRPGRIGCVSTLTSRDTGTLSAVLWLGTPGPTKTDEFSENFQRGEGVSFPIQKISLQFFG